MPYGTVWKKIADLVLLQPSGNLLDTSACYDIDNTDQYIIRHSIEVSCETVQAKKQIN